MKTHVPLAKNVDQPTAALIKDLKLRGMLDDTLVVWTTEFGRTPYDARKRPRARASQPGLQLLAGGRRRRRPASSTGTSDEYGIQVAENEVHMHDFHATILHLLGLNHEKLTYRYAGRDFRLTDVSGNVVHQIIA